MFNGDFAVRIRTVVMITASGPCTISGRCTKSVCGANGISGKIASFRDRRRRRVRCRINYRRPRRRTNRGWSLYRIILRRSRLCWRTFREVPRWFLRHGEGKVGLSGNIQIIVEGGRCLQDRSRSYCANYPIYGFAVVVLWWRSYW